jgi:flavin reductase (DIM6/NTAB) family NADH-FMN oxidoreductase RutF
MSKLRVPVTNGFCPQTLFLYGTYKEDGTPNFGLFCWFSYNWNGGLGAMAAIGENKLTKDRICANGVFSANLVTEEMLPLADYLGNRSGYEADKMAFPLEVEKGQALNVPVLAASPVVFELEVDREVHLTDDSDVFLCKIRAVLHDGALENENQSVAARIAAIRPVCTTCGTYFSWAGEPMGKWGEPGKGFRGRDH